MQHAAHCIAWSGSATTHEPHLFALDVESTPSGQLDRSQTVGVLCHTTVLLDCDAIRSWRWRSYHCLSLVQSRQLRLHAPSLLCPVIGVSLELLVGHSKYFFPSRRQRPSCCGHRHQWLPDHVSNCLPRARSRHRGWSSSTANSRHHSPPLSHSVVDDVVARHSPLKPMLLHVHLVRPAS